MASRFDIFNPVLWFVSNIITGKGKVKLEKIHMDDLKPPYVILSTHGSIMDYFIAYKFSLPYSIFNVCEEIELGSYKRLIKKMGQLYNSKYMYNEKKINDIKKAIKRKRIVVLYPEIKKSIDGTCSVLTRDLVEILKMLNVPVVVLKNQGSYLRSPMWGRGNNLNEIHSQMIQICTKEEIEKISEIELEELISTNMEYDDYTWLKNQRILLTNKEKCIGIENILYRCPQCTQERKIVSKNDKIYCSSCGKQWIMTEYGDMKASLDNNEYIKIHDWILYERDCVKEEIIYGNYNLMMKVRIEIMNRKNKVLGVEPGLLWHNKEGFVLKFNRNGVEEDILIPGNSMYTCYIDFDYKGKGACIGLWCDDTIYYVFPQENISVTKIMLAVEEIYNLTKDFKAHIDRVTDVEEEAVVVEVDELIESEEKIEKDNVGKVIAVEYIDDDIVTSEQAKVIREQAQTVETIPTR